MAARLAAQSAIQDGADALVVDVAGPATFAIEGDDLTGLAAGWRLGRVGAAQRLDSAAGGIDPVEFAR